MKVFAVLFASLFVSAAAGGQSTGVTWITDVTIVSPEALNHVVKGSVLIEGGRIVRVERKPKVKAPAGAKVVSGDGGFLIPGLIDSHVHLASIPGMGFDQRAANAERVKDYYKQLPRSYLYFGYTTVVDLMVIDHQMLKDFREARLMEMARIYEQQKRWLEAQMPDVYVPSFEVEKRQPEAIQRSMTYWPESTPTLLPEADRIALSMTDGRVYLADLTKLRHDGIQFEQDPDLYPTRLRASRFPSVPAPPPLLQKAPAHRGVVGWLKRAFGS